MFRCASQRAFRISVITRSWCTQTEINSETAVDRVPVVKQVPIEDEKKTRLSNIEIDYVLPEEAPGSERFTLKEYPNNYFEAPVINWKREYQNNITLPSAIFGEALRTDIIHRCLRHRVLERQSQDGIKPTKTVSTISGSGRKVSPQKGQGRARRGKVRSNITRGGAKSHGRVARDISIDLPQRVLRFGMRSALSAKYALGQIVFIDNLNFSSRKTKDFASLMKQNQWGDRVMFLHTNISPELRISSHAVPKKYVATIYRVNIWDILRQNLVVMTPEAVSELERIYHPLESVRKQLWKKKMTQEPEFDYTQENEQRMSQQA